MTKPGALKVLGSLAGGVTFIFAAAAHVLWHSGHRRLGLAVLGGGGAAGGLVLCSFLIPSFPLTGRAFSRGRPRDNTVALTFDDGPREPYTGQILDILAAESVPATFFVLGENARRHPDTLRRMEAGGHRVANHGMDHGILMWAGGGEAARQVREAGQALKDAGVREPAPLFRAPHGWLSPLAHRAVSSLGYRVTGWSKGVWDTANPGVEMIVERAAGALEPGCILLLHDGWPGAAGDQERAQTVAALPAIIKRARARGLEFVTVEEMMMQTGNSA